MKRITPEIAFARYVIYQEAADHLLGEVCDNDVERGEIDGAIKVISAIALKWLIVHNRLARKLSGKQ